jgi:replicative DNA helicase
MTTKSPIKAKLELEDSVKMNLMFKMFMTNSAYRDLIVSTFKFQYFKDYPIAIPLQFAIKYYQKYKSIPEVSVLKSIISKYVKNGEYDEVVTLNSIGEALNTEVKNDEFIEHNIIDLLASKTAYNLLIENIETIDSQKTVSLLLSEFTKLSSLSIDNKLGLDYFVQLQEHINELKNPDKRLPTGFERFDKLLGGGWLADGRMLGVFLAPTHVGKSLMLSNLAVRSLQQGKFAVIISLEMSEFIYATRIDAHISGLNINMLSQNLPTMEERIYNFEKLYPGAKLLIKEYPASSISSSTIDSFLQKVSAQYGRKIDIIYIDYLTLVNPSYGADKNTYERGDIVSKELRALSYKYECPVITASQSTRESFKAENIGMENTGSSIAIPQNADFMASLYKNNTADKIPDGHLNMEILKSRLAGNIGEKIVFEVDYNTLSLEEQESFDKPKVKASQKEEQIKTDLQNTLLEL